MLINLRNALMAGRRLPYDAESEYLESTGTQWIDTGYNLKLSDYVKVTASLNNRNSVFGVVNTTGSTERFNLTGGTDVSFAYFGADLLRFGESTTAYDVVYTFKIGNGEFYIDGTLISTKTFTDATIPISCYVFARNVNGSVNDLFKGKIYSFQIYDANGVLVRDFIPVRVGNVGYLYDRVSRRLFGNAGTGDFVVGPDVVPVEYLRGDGSSAIETDIQWQLKAAYTEVDFRMPDTRDSATRQLLGSSAETFNYISARRATRADYFGFNAATDPLLELVSGTQYKGAAWYENDLYNFNLNGSVATYSTTVHGTAGSFCVFAFTRSSYENVCFKGDISAVRIYADKTKAQLLNNLQAIRVGTGSSWEGAMMDTLTRRIYRNAGTGAFGYGNDLKYPIPA